MSSLQVTNVPVMRTGMLVRKPVSEVFDAFVDPKITTRFWFTKRSGRLEVGKHVQQVADSTQGISLVLAGLKALLEHDVELNLVGDRYPKGIEEH